MPDELELKHHTEDDRERGLYGKYLVIKRAGDQVIWKSFVLRYDQDPFALPALAAYADACAARYPKLAADIRGIVAWETEHQQKLREAYDRIDKMGEGK